MPMPHVSRELDLVANRTADLFDRGRGKWGGLSCIREPSRMLAGILGYHCLPVGAVLKIRILA